MSADGGAFSFRHQEENQTCWKYNVLCQTTNFQWLINHHIYDKHLIDLIMDYCGDSALSAQEWLDWMNDEQNVDLIHFSGFTPDLSNTDSNMDYTSFLSLENKAPLCISFCQEDCTHIYSNHGGLFYIQLTELATERLIKLIQKLVDQFTIKNHAPRPFSKQPWRIDYGSLSYFARGSLKLGFYNLSALQVFVRQMTPNLITYHKKPDFKRQVWQVLLDQNTEYQVHIVDQVYRVCVRISDIYIKDLSTVGINIELSTFELYHDKMKMKQIKM